MTIIAFSKIQEYNRLGYLRLFLLHSFLFLEIDTILDHGNVAILILTERKLFD